MPPPRTLRLQTPRLTLRPSAAADAGRAIEIQSNWNVARNLRMARFPVDRTETAAWFAAHDTEWRAGTAFRFAMLCDDRMIGLVDIDEIRDGEGDLGYWLEEAAWGRGYAFEASTAVVQFGFGAAGLTALNSGHAADNPASGRILTRLGFHSTEEVAIPSRARGTGILQRRFRLDRPS